MVRYESDLLPNNAFEVNMQNLHPLDQPILRRKRSSTHPQLNTAQPDTVATHHTRANDEVSVETISKGFKDLIGFLQMLLKLTRFVCVQVWRFIVWLDLISLQNSNLVHLPSFGMGLLFLFIVLTLFGRGSSVSAIVSLFLCGGVLALLFSAETTTAESHNTAHTTEVVLDEDRPVRVAQGPRVVRRNSDRPRIVNLAFENMKPTRRNSTPKVEKTRYHAFVENAQR